METDGEGNTIILPHTGILVTTLWRRNSANFWIVLHLFI